MSPRLLLDAVMIGLCVLVCYWLFNWLARLPEIRSYLLRFGGTQIYFFRPCRGVFILGTVVFSSQKYIKFSFSNVSRFLAVFWTWSLISQGSGIILLACVIDSKKTRNISENTCG